MRRQFGIIFTLVIVIVVLIALSLAGNIEFDRPTENELSPIRSSYNSGPTGTRAFYQLLEESGVPVARWRDDYFSLEDGARNATVIAVGPFAFSQKPSGEETRALQRWVAGGGRLLIISRSPREQFGDPVIHSENPPKMPDWDAPPEQIVNDKSDELISQPTALTRDVRGLALSVFASKMKFHPPDPADPNATKAEDDVLWPEPSPPTPPTPEPTAKPDEAESQQDADNRVEEYSTALLYAPVTHLGDKEGAVMADFIYGKGRVIFLSDPFVIANNGIARGGNLTLALNMVSSLGGSERTVFFDEFHHGYGSESNPLVNYFRGTPVPWLLFQGVLLSLLLIYTYGRRFARPLPLPQVDRHSPLEFVSSMANLQQVAQARDLALENIYPRFKAQLCRRIGLSSRAQKDEIIECARRLRLPVSEIELRQTLSDAELTLSGERIDDERLVTLVARMRRIISQIKRR
jgi:hypothetical protein